MKYFFKKLPSFSEIIVISGIVVLMSMICETGLLGIILITLVVIFIIRTAGRIY